MARRRRKSSFKVPGLSYSYKRALGISSAKRRISRATGIPLTKSGRQRKVGRMMTGGCLLPVLMMSIAVLTVLAVVIL